MGASDQQIDNLSPLFFSEIPREQSKLRHLLFKEIKFLDQCQPSIFLA